MPRGQSRSPEQKLADLAEMSVLYVKGMSTKELAERYGVSTSTILADIKEIRVMWLASSIRNFDEVRAEQLHKIDVMESEAWTAWKASQSGTQSQSVKTKGRGIRKSEVNDTGKIEVFDEFPTERSLVTEKSPGDTRYMSIIQWCIEKRLLICGIIGPDAINGGIGGQTTEAGRRLQENIQQDPVAQELARRLALRLQFGDSESDGDRALHAAKLLEDGYSSRIARQTARLSVSGEDQTPDGEPSATSGEGPSS